MIIATIPRSGIIQTKIQKIWTGIFISGVIFIFQASIFSLYFIIASRFHGVDFLNAFTSVIGNFFGLKTIAQADSIFVGIIDNNFSLAFSWEIISSFIFMNLFIGALIIFLFFSRRKRLGFSLLKFFIIGFIYAILRFLFLLIFIAEKVEYGEGSSGLDILDIYYDPLFQFLSFVPLILLLINFISLESLDLNFLTFKHFKMNKKQVMASIMIFFFVFSSVGVYGFQDPGVKKQGSVLIDELHSDWEDTVRPIDTEWYGKLSTYSYYVWAEWLKHYYTIDQNINETLTMDLLRNYDILILKCPTNAYSDEEVSSIIQFVKDGGGLYLIGDHTNVFGMNFYLNQVARDFDIEFNFDSTYDPSLPSGYVIFTPPKILPHPIVQSVPQFQFLTACTLDAPLNAEEVMLCTKLRAHSGTYAQRDFFSLFEAESGTRGIFLHSVALKYGKGRVVAFTDSTVFSTFSMMMDGYGYKTYNLGALDYLNRENKYEYLNLLFLIIALIALGVSGFLLRKDKIITSILLFISIGIIAFSMATSAFSYVNELFYASPEPVLEFNKSVGFDMVHSGAVIKPRPSAERYFVYSREHMERYNTFFVWTTRVGCNPSLHYTIDSAINQSDLIIIINPVEPFTDQEKLSISKYLKNGGNLLLMDSINNLNSTSNDLLTSYDIEIIPSDENEIANISRAPLEGLFESEDTLPYWIVKQPRLIVNGAEDIFIDEKDLSVLSTKNVGNGVLAIFVDSYLFSDAKMSGVFVTPDALKRKIYDLEYYLLDNLLFNEEDITPAKLDGYVYIDENNNERWDSSSDQPFSNINITLWKVDNFGIEKNEIETYFISKETSTNNTGNYLFSHMIPGYYLINASHDNVTIHQNIIFLYSGNNSYNISKPKPGSIEGTVYFDLDKNLQYDAGEEIRDVKIDILIKDINDEKKLVDTIISDEKGNYIFSSLTPGFYTINATRVNTTTGYRDYRTEKTIKLQENHEIIYNVSLNLVPVKISGYTTYQNETKGNIILAFVANLSVDNNTATKFQFAFSNDTGAYEVELLPGYYNVTVNETENESGQDFMYYFTGRLVIHVGEGTRSFNIALSRDES